MFAALAKFIRELITQDTHEVWRRRVLSRERIGRPQAMTENQVSHARGLLTDAENTIVSIADVPSQPI
ncbi:hypothetical protein WDA79_07270 [Streptomyces sp. A475]|uniref:hypothetical protein n=1 Tax=Streptomyces sp. A475 TaxID=3131976 RepID=UPI0030C91E7B